MMIAVNPAEILRELDAVGITLTVLGPDRLRCIMRIPTASRLASKGCEGRVKG